MDIEPRGQVRCRAVGALRVWRPLPDSGGWVRVKGPEYKLIGVHRSVQPIKNLCVARTCDNLGRRSRRRAKPGGGVAVVDNRRARACAIRSAIARV